MEEEVGDPDAGVRRVALIGEGDDADPPHFVLRQVGAHLRRCRRATAAEAERADEEQRIAEGCEHTRGVSARHVWRLSASPLAYGRPTFTHHASSGSAAGLSNTRTRARASPGRIDLVIAVK